MKPQKSISLAIWLLEHLAFGSDREALCGDLLEHLQSGRSAGWFWREVLMAIGIGVSRAFGRYALSAVFSAGWSALYPAWAVWGPARFSAAMLHDSEAMVWPLSSIASLAQGFVPVMTFIWLGLAAFLLLRKDLLPRVSIFRLLNALSCSLSVLLVETLCMPKPSGCRGPGCIAKPDFYSMIHLSAINIPLAMSVFVAILCVLPREPQPPRRRRSRSPKAIRAKWEPEMTHPV